MGPFFLFLFLFSFFLVSATVSLSNEPRSHEGKSKKKKKKIYKALKFIGFVLKFFFIYILNVLVSWWNIVEALISIKKELDDPHGVLNNWDEYSVDPCSWAMITCSPENLVIALLVSLFFCVFSNVCLVPKHCTFKL